MKQLWIGTAVIGTALITAPVLGYAQALDIGKREYVNSCAVCHGTSGKGDGPLAGQIKTKVSDLTIIAKNNVGVFPFARIYDLIDGRQAVEAHGPRDMPVWGNVYSMEWAGGPFDFAMPRDRESFVRGRILAVIGYIYSLQVK